MSFLNWYAYIKISGDKSEIKTTRLLYKIPNNGFIRNMPYPITIELTKANTSYRNKNLCLMRCLKIGTNPKVQREMYSSVNTFDVYLRRDESKIEAKKMAFMLVGVPK